MVDLIIPKEIGNHHSESITIISFSVVGKNRFNILISPEYLMEVRSQCLLMNI